MESLRLTCRTDEKDFLIAELAERGTLGISESDEIGGTSRLEAFFEERWAADEWARYEPEWTRHDAEALATAWQREWVPIEAGERFFLVPDWRDDPAPPGRLRLTVHAGQASGSGYFAPTQLTLRALERAIRAGDRFLDVGTGSGILCSAAHLLGARWIAGCDVDPVAVEQARESGIPAVFWVGSPRSARAGAFDVVAANLNGHTLAVLRDDLVRVTAPGGRIVLCGFKPHWERRLVEAFAMPVAGRVADGGYCAVTLEVSRAGGAG